MSAAVSEAVLDAAAEYLKTQYGASYGLDHPIDRQRILAALQEGSGALPASPSVTSEGESSDRGLAGDIMDALWPILGGNHTDAEVWHEIGAEISAAIEASEVGMEPKAECAQPSRSDILERIRAFDFKAAYGEPEYERLADDLEALAQPNQPRDREEGLPFGYDLVIRAAIADFDRGAAKSGDDLATFISIRLAALSPKNTESEHD